MALLTIEEYGTRFSSDEANIPGEVGQDLQTIIDDAIALVETYIPAAYVVPLPMPPAALKVAASDIARFYVYKDSAPEVVRQRYEDAIVLLNRVQKGLFQLGVANEVPPPAPPDGNSTGASFVTRPRQFTSTWDSSVAGGSDWDI